MDQNNDKVDIIQQQQDLYEMFGYKSFLIYDSYPNKVFLEMKIGFLLPSVSEAQRCTLADMIWSQRTHTGNMELLMSPIFVHVVKDKDISDRITYPLNIKSKEHSVHCVFRIKKCSGTAVDENGQNECCAIFVDEFCRVYQNWADFIKNNKYDDGLVVAPRLGIYNASPSTNQVLLEICLRKSGVTKALDIGSTAISVVSAAVTGAALIPAVTFAPVVLGVASVAGVTCAAYTGLRNAFKLYDRKKHKQSIGLSDKEARSAWINVGICALSATSVGATNAIARAASNGRNISTLARTSARVVNIGSISMNVGACVEEVTSLLISFRNNLTAEQVARLSVALFFLTHSVKNYYMAQAIMASEATSIQDALNATQKQSFNILVTKTIEVCGNAVQPIIRSVKKCLTDPELVLKMIREMCSFEDGELQEKIAAFTIVIFGTIGPDIAREYLRDFDKYINKLIQSIEKKLNVSKLHQLMRPIIKLLRELTIKACNKFVEFIECLVIEIAQSFNRIKTSKNLELVIKMMHIKCEHRSANLGTNLNEYILSDEFKMNSNVATIDEAFLVEIEDIYEAEFGSVPDIDEDRKLELLINEYADQHTEEFKQCSPASNEKQLHETIVSILKQLPYEMATKFFNLAKKLISEHAKDIQQNLGRFLSVDIFIEEIYCLLVKRSAANNYDSLIAYLSAYDDTSYEAVEMEFKAHYAVKHDYSLKKIACPTCKGIVFD